MREKESGTVSARLFQGALIDWMGVKMGNEERKSGNVQEDRPNQQGRGSTRNNNNKGAVLSSLEMRILNWSKLDKRNDRRDQERD